MDTKFLFKEISVKQKIINIFWKICWVSIFIYFAYHLTTVIRSAVNIPYADDWDIIHPHEFILGWSKNFLFCFHNEHRIAFTKLFFLLNYQFFKFNLRYQIIFNIFFYVGLLFSIWNLIGKKIGHGRSFIALAAFLPFLSNILSINHTMALLLQNTMFVLLWGTYFLFFHKSWYSLVFSMFLFVLAIYNFAGAVFGSITISVIYLFWYKTTKPKDYFLKLILIFIILGCSIFLWLHGFEKGPSHPGFSAPWDIKFIRFLGEIISQSFGFTSLNPFAAYLSLTIVVIALFSSITTTLKTKNKDPQTWFIIALTCCVFVMLMVVSFARASFPLEQAKAANYVEFSIFLPILSLALFNPSESAKGFGSYLILFVLLFGLYDNFKLSDYNDIRESRLQAKKCVMDLIDNPQNNPTGLCPTIYHGRLTEIIGVAKELDLSFMK